MAEAEILQHAQMPEEHTGSEIATHIVGKIKFQTYSSRRSTSFSMSPSKPMTATDKRRDLEPKDCSALLDSILCCICSFFRSSACFMRRSSWSEKRAESPLRLAEGATANESLATLANLSGKLSDLGDEVSRSNSIGSEIFFDGTCSGGSGSTASDSTRFNGKNV